MGPDPEAEIIPHTITLPLLLSEPNELNLESSQK